MTKKNPGLDILGPGFKSQFSYQLSLDGLIPAVFSLGLSFPICKISVSKGLPLSDEC